MLARGSASALSPGANGAVTSSATAGFSIMSLVWVASRLTCTTKPLPSGSVANGTIETAGSPPCSVASAATRCPASGAFRAATSVASMALRDKSDSPGRFEPGGQLQQCTADVIFHAGGDHVPARRIVRLDDHLQMLRRKLQQARWRRLVLPDLHRHGGEHAGGRAHAWPHAQARPLAAVPPGG